MSRSGYVECELVVAYTLDKCPPKTTRNVREKLCETGKQRKICKMKNKVITEFGENLF